MSCATHNAGYLNILLPQLCIATRRPWPTDGMRAREKPRCGFWRLHKRHRSNCLRVLRGPFDDSWLPRAHGPDPVWCIAVKVLVGVCVCGRIPHNGEAVRPDCLTRHNDARTFADRACVPLSPISIVYGVWDQEACGPALCNVDTHSMGRGISKNSVFHWQNHVFE